MEPQGLTRVRIVFHGAVQGVCFRATAAELSRGFAVTGHVRNRADGTVDLEAQGAPDQVEAFLSAIRRRYTPGIQSEERFPLPTSAEQGFVILR